jgi:hypothetical protein
VPQHISRKELKTDEVRDTLAHGIEEILVHQKGLALIVIVAVIVAGAIFGWRFYTERQTAKAGAEFDVAMTAFQGRVLTAGDQNNVVPGETTYPDDKTKYQDAAKKFGAVAMDYPHTRPGQLAHYYAALSLEHLGDNENARKWLEGISDSGTEDFAAMAKFELARIDDKMGKSADALKLYQELIAKPTVLVPKPVVMMALAEHYGPANSAEAAKVYNQIKSEYPDTTISQQADQELALLPGKS